MTIKHKDYSIFSYRMLQSFEEGFLKDMKDSTLTNKEKANVKTELNKVRKAMKNK